MKIIILDGYTTNPGDLSWEKLKNLGECIIYERTESHQIIERCKDVDAILTNKVAIDANTMKQLPKLKYIGVLATGYNIIDLDAAQFHNITVTNIPAYSTNSVAQMVFAHIFNITNQIRIHSDDVHSDNWSKSIDFCYWKTPQIEIAHKKIGIIGLGNIGQAVARIAIAFGMEVFAYTSKVPLQLPFEIKKLSLDELFKTCDIITLHCPLAEDTFHLVNTRLLSLMKPSAILINTGRGPLIDEQALAEALNKGNIYAAGIDCLSTEPPQKDNPLIKARNCYITPHIAWATLEARQRLIEITVNNLIAFINENPINTVNKKS